MSRRLGVLISGRGSNLRAILAAIRSGELVADIAVVVSSRPEADGLAFARSESIEAVVLRPRDYPDRHAYDGAIAETLRARGVDLVCLAGFMRLVGPPLLEAFPDRILNIHPALLPAFPGLDAQTQAVDYGVRVSGATVHIVTAGLDDGPIVLQAVVPVLDNDTPASLAARILVEEHKLYPAAIKLVLDGAWHLEGRRFIREASAR